MFIIPGKSLCDWSVLMFPYHSVNNILYAFLYVFSIKRENIFKNYQQLFLEKDFGFS